MRSKKGKKENKVMNSIIEWVKVFASAIVLAFVITLFIKPTLVRGDSMVPTLHENDYLIINKIGYRISEPKNGDVVVFKSDLAQEDGTNKNLVKRVIGIPGDKVVIKDGNVYVNGKQLQEDYLEEGTYTEGDTDITVPENKIFVLGDNRKISLDSRSELVGLVDIDKLEGKVFVRLYPFNDISTIK